jgi:hypothetical protein
MAGSHHPSTEHVLQFFAYDHLPEHLQVISAACYDLAHEMAEVLPDGPELTVGLRDLLRAKDCFVRAAVVAGKGS